MLQFLLSFAFLFLEAGDAEDREVDRTVGAVMVEVGQRGEVVSFGVFHDEERAGADEAAREYHARYVAEAGHVVGRIDKDDVV